MIILRKHRTYNENIVTLLQMLILMDFSINIYEWFSFSGLFDLSENVKASTISAEVFEISIKKAYASSEFLFSLNVYKLQQRSGKRLIGL